MIDGNGYEINMSVKEYEYWLPGENGTEILHKTNHNSVILIWS